jgi:hypothetical protein
LKASARAVNRKAAHFPSQRKKAAPEGAAKFREETPRKGTRYRNCDIATQQSYMRGQHRQAEIFTSYKLQRKLCNKNNILLNSQADGRFAVNFVRRSRFGFTDSQNHDAGATRESFFSCKNKPLAET